MSLIKGYSKGLLLGLQLQDAEREKEERALRNRLYEEQIESARSSREIAQKSFLARLEEDKRQAKREEREEAGKYTQISPAMLEELGLPLAPYMSQAEISSRGIESIPFKGTPLDIAQTLTGIRKARKEGTERQPVEWINAKESWVQGQMRERNIPRQQAEYEWSKLKVEGRPSATEGKTPRERISAKQVEEVTKAQSIPPNFVLQIYKSTGTPEEQSTADTMYAETMAKQFNIPNTLQKVQELGKFYSYDEFIDSPLAQNYEQNLSDEAFDKLKDIAKWFYGEGKGGRSEGFGWEQPK